MQNPITLRWDLTGLVPGRINLAALTCFLAVADRVRDFVPVTPRANLGWHPKVLGFLRDIGFLSIAREWNLCSWEGTLGGYVVGKTNPTTRLIACERAENFQPPPFQPPGPFEAWKKQQRDSITGFISPLFSRIFYDRRGVDIVLTNCVAELVLNAWLWGQTHAFVGCQRSTDGRVSVAVCDCGCGLWESIRFGQHNDQRPACRIVKDELDAMVTACLLQDVDHGLRRTISSIINNHDGWVKLTSGNTQVEWNTDTWPIKPGTRSQYHDDERVDQLILEGRSLLLKNGRMFRWPNRIRGSRIAFEFSQWK